MKTNTPFTPHALGTLTLANRIVMAPMTRSRAIHNLANDLMATYYAQRASAGLIITEAVSPSPNGLGYARIPGIFTAEQTQSWKQVPAAVHHKGGKIFLQLMHTGRIGHSLNLPNGGRVLGPSAIQAKGQMWTDQQGLLNFPAPQALTPIDLQTAKAEFVQAARNAIEAGFDGVELHGANGYLLEQFLNPNTNNRTDNYGGSVENRIRFVVEVVQEVSNAIGKDKTGIRLSPYSLFNDMSVYPEIDLTYQSLAIALETIGLVYIHVVNNSVESSSDAFLNLRKTIRDSFKNTLILSGGYDLIKANHDLSSDHGDLIAFGRPFISNPDLVYRFTKNLPLNIKLDSNTFYSPGEKGYTDYPVFQEETITAF